MKRKLQENEVFAAATECEALSLRMMNAVAENSFSSAQSYGLKSKSATSSALPKNYLHLHFRSTDLRAITLRPRTAQDRTGPTQRVDL